MNAFKQILEEVLDLISGARIEAAYTKADNQYRLDSIKGVTESGQQESIARFFYSDGILELVHFMGKGWALLPDAIPDDQLGADFHLNFDNAGRVAKVAGTRTIIPANNEQPVSREYRMRRYEYRDENGLMVRIFDNDVCVSKWRHDSSGRILRDSNGAYCCTYKYDSASIRRTACLGKKILEDKSFELSGKEIIAGYSIANGQWALTNIWHDDNVPQSVIINSNVTNAWTNPNGRKLELQVIDPDKRGQESRISTEPLFSRQWQSSPLPASIAITSYDTRDSKANNFVRIDGEVQIDQVIQLAPDGRFLSLINSPLTFRCIGRVIEPDVDGKNFRLQLRSFKFTPEEGGV